MKRIFLWLLLSGMTTTFCYAQVAVRTEGPSGLFKHIHIAKTDTITTAKFFVGVVVNSSVASDSIIIRSGTVTDTVAIIVLVLQPRHCRSMSNTA